MSNLTKIRIGTRKSALALAQTEEVSAKLREAWPGIAVECVPMVTSGDKFTDRPLADIGGKGLFTKELEDALIENRIDIAVHSTKDMQTVLPTGLILGCMLKRENPRDMLVGEGLHSIADLPHGATFGTASLRRSAQLLMKRPDLVMVPLRGNVQTRLNKLAQGEMRATMLAIAGLNRLGLDNVPGVVLSCDEFLPAIAQGAIGIECRADDTAVRDALAAIAHQETEIAVTCERAFLRALDGSCRTPIAGYAEITNTRLHFRGLIIRPDGSAYHRCEAAGDIADAERMGREAGEKLLKDAGSDFIR